MLGVIYHWSVKDGTPMCAQRFTYQQFDYACRGFAVDKAVIVDPTSEFPLETTEEVVSDLASALALFPNCIPLFLDKSGDNILLGYDHPVDAVYVIGPDYSSFNIPAGSATFRIDMADPVLELWADQVIVMALAHRYAALSQ
jgi:hypothetical protein